MFLSKAVRLHMLIWIKGCLGSTGRPLWKAKGWTTWAFDVVQQGTSFTRKQQEPGAEEMEPQQRQRHFLQTIKAGSVLFRQWASREHLSSLIFSGSLEWSDSPNFSLVPGPLSLILVLSHVMSASSTHWISILEKICQYQHEYKVCQDMASLHQHLLWWSQQCWVC